MNIDGNVKLDEQLSWHWDNAIRPRLKGLTDEEYLWEPVPGCWNIRPRGESTAQISAGTGDHTIDFAIPQPEPAPVTTIAWRMAHIVVDIFGARTASHFGGPETHHTTFAHASTAQDALVQLEGAYAAWTAGVRSLGNEGLARKCGPAEGPHAEEPMAALVLLINREVIHHAAEIALLRDLYPMRSR